MFLCSDHYKNGQFSPGVTKTVREHGGTCVIKLLGCRTETGIGMESISRSPGLLSAPVHHQPPLRGIVSRTIYVSFLDPFIWSPTESGRMDGSVGREGKDSLLRGSCSPPYKDRHAIGQLWRQPV